MKLLKFLATDAAEVPYLEAGHGIGNDLQQDKKMTCKDVHEETKSFSFSRHEIRLALKRH